MNDLIVKLFGINRMNLLGWCIVGLMIIGLSVVCTVQAVLATPNFFNRPDLLLLGAIVLLMLGIFGVQLQIYCAMLAQKIERNRAERRRPDEYDD
jgi:hypothetical protein